MKPVFEVGNNIAIKVPPGEYEATVRFYRDVLGLEQTVMKAPGESPGVTFRFGAMNLWIDRHAAAGRAEVWLEVVTDDIDRAEAYLAGQGIARRDEVEPLPAGFRGFWIASPANIIHLVDEKGAPS